MSDETGQSALRDLLASGLEQLNLDATPPQQALLAAFIALLSRWSSAYNLTAVRDPLDMVSRHILDSLSLAPYLPANASRIIDVGTGAGLPGVPLAVIFPDRHFDLLDANGKKTRFLFQVKTELGLTNMTVCHVRAEAWRPPVGFAEGYDVVLTRAFASLSDMLARSAHLCRPGGLFLAMKGRRPDVELQQLPDFVTDVAVHRLEVPGLSEERHVVAIQVARQRDADVLSHGRDGEVR